MRRCHYVILAPLMIRHHHYCSLLIALTCTMIVSSTWSADARLLWHVKRTSDQPQNVITRPATTGGDENGPTPPIVVPPSSLIDLTSAKFGKLEVDLKQASFLDASVKDLRLSATNMDMTNGILDNLLIDADHPEFQDFIIDSFHMSTSSGLHFDTNQLLNNKILQFREPAAARVSATVSQTSLNAFINSPAVLARLSGSAKKRVPLLSTLARQDVLFGFDFLGGILRLEPDNHVHLGMDSKVGLAKAKISMPLAVDAKLSLENGWVNLSDTRLLTSGQVVPKDVSSKIIERINSLSKWGEISDDIRFQFTDLKVVPGDRLELQGTAVIRRLRLTRVPDADNTPP
jgi:hypothetical protein